MIFQQLARLLVSDINDALDFGIEFGGGVIAVVASAGDRVAEKWLLGIVAVIDHAD